MDALRLQYVCVDDVVVVVDVVVGGEFVVVFFPSAIAIVRNVALRLLITNRKLFPSEWRMYEPEFYASVSRISDNFVLASLYVNSTLCYAQRCAIWRRFCLLHLCM